jgi:uncharacterized membrane protein
MNSDVNTFVQLFLRWAHFVAGILWIGHLYFFNFVNAHVAKVLDGPTKKALVPELMPRALYWFRWGAAWTWITGLLLLVLIYYHGGTPVVFENPETGTGWLWLAIVLVLLAVGFLIYNAVMKSVKNVLAANTIVLILFVAVYLFLEYVGKFGGRALYIHAGGILGTMMFMNVWMVIWPYQKKIITATKEGTPPDAALVASAGLRSRHNTYMSVPLVFFMISNHYPTMYAGTYRDVCALGVLVLGFGAVRLLYGKSAKVTGF